MKESPSFMRFKNKMLAGGIVFLLLVMVLIPSVESISMRRISESDESSFFENGVTAGRQYRVLYRFLDVCAGVKLSSRVSDEEIREHLGLLEEQYPFFFEELRGLSFSTHIQMERLVALQWFFMTQFGGACTTTLSTGDATKFNETFLTQNYDMTIDFNQCPLLSLVGCFFVLRNCHIVRTNTLRYRYVYWGVPVLYEVPALNEAGLGFGGNGLRLTENESRPIDEGPGLATYMLERLTMMTCKNVSEVAVLWKNTERASSRHGFSYPNFWDNSISMWCDRDGGILSIEQTHTYILCVFGNMTEVTHAQDGILWHANHHQWLDANLTGSVLPDEGGVRVTNVSADGTSTGAS